MHLLFDFPKNFCYNIYINVMEVKKIIIYKRTNKINGKIYIGQTINEPEKRWKAEDNSNQKIGKAVRKYGSENFDNIIIDTATTREELNEKEKYWIAFYDSTNPNKGYNMTSGGSGRSSSTYRNIIIWDSKKLMFPTEISLVRYLLTQTNLYTESQIRRLVRIGLRRHDNIIQNEELEDTLLDIYYFKDFKELENKNIEDYVLQNCYNACNNFG